MTHKSGKTSAITLVAHPVAFFRDLVVEALGRQRVRTRPETEFYLVNLLNRFMTTEHLYTQSGDGGMREEPLALMMKEAIETPQAEARSSLFRHIGDVSLYTAGFFQESLSRKLVDVDYYIGVGGIAYQRVASITEELPQRDIFEELARKFSAFVEVFADVSDKTACRSEKDLLRLYDLWLKTGSARAKKALKDAGIVPHSGLKKKIL